MGDASGPGCPASLIRSASAADELRQASHPYRGQAGFQHIFPHQPSDFSSQCHTFDSMKPLSRYRLLKTMSPSPFAKAFCLLLLLQLNMPEAHAQSDWQQGYVVTNAGDTLRGMVRDRNTGPFGSLYRKIRIKPAGKRTRRFKPAQIQSYTWGTVRFVTLYTESRSELLRTEVFVQASGGTPNFYRVISEGPLSLYHQEFNDPDNSTTDFIPYFKREGDPRLIRATQGIFGLKKKLLSKFFADRPDLVERINDGSLKTPEEVVEAY